MKSFGNLCNYLGKKKPEYFWRFKHKIMKLSNLNGITTEGSRSEEELLKVLHKMQ